MASPQDPPTQAQTNTVTQPLTPPADAPTAQPSMTATAAAAAGAAAQPPSRPMNLPSNPPTSLSDAGTSKRPRDARLIHLILASLGVSAYQERVPLQLLDFAYRYTSSVLSDAAYIQAEGYDTAHESSTAAGKGRGKVVGSGGAGGGGGPAAGSGGGAAGAGGSGASGGMGSGEKEEVSLASLRMAIGSRMQYQYQGTLPKEFLMGLAKERNRVGLGVGRGLNTAQDTGQIIGGVKLPPEKYCLTGVGWGLRDEWDSEGEEERDEMPSGPEAVWGGNGLGDGENGPEEGMGYAGEDEEATMEDIFGDDGGGGGEDENMRDG